MIVKMVESVNERFANLSVPPADPVFGVANKCKADPDTRKINMGVGAYRTDEGKPYIFESVKEAERRILDNNTDHEYSAIEGVAAFNKLCQELLFGDQAGPHIATVQALSGTGALRIGAEFLAEHAPGVVYISKPTWPNHYTIFKRAGL